MGAGEDGAVGRCQRPACWAGTLCIPSGHGRLCASLCLAAIARLLAHQARHRSAAPPPAAQAIRDSFSLEIDLYAVQNKERRRVMFNQDVSTAE